MSPTFEEAVHFTHGDAAAATLQSLGARNILVRRDLLTVGPCDVDPARHAALRAQYWGGWPQTPTGLPGADGDEALRAGLAANGAAPIVVWASRAWSDLTYLWSLIDALARVGAERPWIVRPVADEPTVSMGGVPAERVRRAFDGVELLQEEIARSCVNFWHAYADPSPLGFDALRRRGATVVPELGRILQGHAAWFPWRREGRLWLADADAAIFRWADGGELRHAMHVMHWIGDSCLFARADAWRALGMLDRQTGAPVLTDAGRRLRDEGTLTRSELAPTWIGGCRVGGGRPPPRGGAGGAPPPPPREKEPTGLAANGAAAS
jgi:hypothetical protein